MHDTGKLFMDTSDDVGLNSESWLGKATANLFGDMQGSASIASTKADVNMDINVDLAPYMPLAMSASFMHSAFKQHALDLTGELHTILDIVIDFSRHAVVSASIIVQTPDHFIKLLPVDLKSETLAAMATLVTRESASELATTELDAMLMAANNPTIFTRDANIQVDVVRIVDMRLFNRLMPVITSAKNQGRGPSTALASIASALSVLLAGCRDGLVHHYPHPDKLAAFGCKAGHVFHDNVLETLASAAGLFFPRGSTVIVLHTGEAMAAYRASRDQKAIISLEPILLSPVTSVLPPGPDSYDAIANIIKKKSRVDVIIFLSIAGIAGTFTDLVDGIAAGTHDNQGPALVRAIAESLLFYLRTVKQSWYSRPRPMLFKLFPRFLLRFSKLRLDLPRLLHDRLSLSLIAFIEKSFGTAFSIVTCFPVPVEDGVVFKACETKFKEMIPRAISLVDSIVFAGIEPKKVQASELASMVHARLASVSPTTENRFVLVLTPRFASIAGKVLKTMFRRVAWNPFALLNILKACTGKRDLGLFPVPPAFESLLTLKYKKLAAKLSRAFFLKY